MAQTEQAPAKGRQHPGQMRKEMIVQPGDHASGKIEKGQILRVTDVEGKQVADFCSFNLYDPREYFSCIYTGGHSTYSWQWKPGDVLVSIDFRPMWTILEDTSPGVHYCLGGYCSRALRSHVARSGAEAGGVGGYGCKETLERALAEHGLTRDYLVPDACFNIFMNYPFQPDGSWNILEPVSRAGDYMDLRAEMDILWAVSVCYTPGACNGYNPTPLKFQLYDPPR